MVLTFPDGVTAPMYSHAKYIGTKLTCPELRSGQVRGPCCPPNNPLAAFIPGASPGVFGQKSIKRVEKKLKDGKVKVSALVKNTGTKKYLKFEKNNKETAILDEEKIKEAQRWDGIFGIVTSHDKEKVSGGEIFERYRGLWQVEDAFRVNKRDLKMRPIYHWTPKRIKSHVLICYMAYALVARVKYKLKKAKLKLSIERIREELGYLQASVVKDQKTGRRFLLPSKVTDTQRAICDALGVKLQEKIQILK